MITLLNAAVLTNPGTYCLEPVSTEDAQHLIHHEEWQSAIGHAATAELISELLGVNVPARRIEYRQAMGERALVFQLSKRPPEGLILRREELEQIGYGWALLTRLG